MVGTCIWRETTTATTTAIAEEEEEATPPPQPTTCPSSLKPHLLSVVAGLDRGLVSNEADVMTVESVAKKLEASGGIVDFSTGLDKLQGRWRLLYNSAFAFGSLGGFRPFPRGLFLLLYFIRYLFNSNFSNSR